MDISLELKGLPCQNKVYLLTYLVIIYYLLFIIYYLLFIIYYLLFMIYDL